LGVGKPLKFPPREARLFPQNGKPHPEKGGPPPVLMLHKRTKRENCQEYHVTKQMNILTQVKSHKEVHHISIALLSNLPAAVLECEYIPSTPDFSTFRVFE